MGTKTFALKKPLAIIGLVLIAAALIIPSSVFATGGEAENPSAVYATIWSLVPPIAAILLALITKEVYSSLFIGVFVGTLFYANFNIPFAIESLVNIISEELGANGGIIIFLVELGIIVAMMQLSGCSVAFGRWASSKIKTKRGALLATTAMGLLFFVDDYFNCLTTGNIMRPITDEHKISRARLAYNIDCTAAPVCIIAPISSWAAAVSSYVPSNTGIDGFAVFVQAIPYNYYALLTILMLFSLAILGFDFGPMRKYEKMAAEGDIYGGTGDLYADVAKPPENPRGKVMDMILPVIVLVISCVWGLLYSGGFFTGEGVTVIQAFSNCDAFLALPMGGLITLAFTILLYLPRKVVTPKEFTDCITDGVHLMVPAMLILVFSWALSTVCRSNLGATEFVHNFMSNSNFNMLFLPFVLYVLGTLISFATGTAWGTFGIMIPMVIAIFGEINTLSLICISAALSGSVTGDHCSPISETAIMSSTAAQVKFMQHVLTQLPYAIFVAVLSSIGFLLAGFIQNAAIVLIIMAVLMVSILVIIKKYLEHKESKLQRV